ncbi:DUF4738 domain-containing protein [Tenacibaculum xiamenense]|uniref:DUF4738 domain-containing protein n=1 Tax=Tenacibaculum xiamenense TaxID=1261553 RepID=UPI003895FBBB
MKHLFISILIIFSSSCSRKKSEKTRPDSKSQSQLKTDTIISYWQTDYDTISKNREIKIENELYQLELTTYSLNDSSIIKTNKNYKEVYHNWATEIILTRLNDTVLYRKLTKKPFKDSLNPEFYKLAILTNIEYDGIRSNRLFFKGELNVPDTDWVIGNNFGVFYKTEQKNKIQSWNYEDIGL